jgi:hypothetical protein
MPISEELFKAVLAMDSYNRGDNAGIAVSGSEIGTATVRTDDLPVGSGDASFFAQAYDWNSETIISYRGTDVLPFPNPLDPGNWEDIGAWSLFLGNYWATQARLAADFYRAIDQTTSGTIELTGHSLGGGLSGFVAATYGLSATTFDHIDFRIAATVLYDFTRLGLDEVAKTFYYGQNEPNAPNFLGITAFAVEGEIAGVTRSDPLGAVSNIALGSNVSLSIEDRHSQALLVTTMFGHEAAGTNWLSAASSFLPALFSDEIGREVGFVKGETQPATGRADEGDQMISAIAYSAIDEGTRVFGDTGIRALFNDANDLGALLADEEVSSTLQDAAGAIGKVFVQFAGQLAFNKVLISSTTVQSRLFC